MMVSDLCSSRPRARPAPGAGPRPCRSTGCQHSFFTIWPPFMISIILSRQPRTAGSPGGPTLPSSPPGPRPAWPQPPGGSAGHRRQPLP